MNFLKRNWLVIAAIIIMFLCVYRAAQLWNEDIARNRKIINAPYVGLSATERNAEKYTLAGPLPENKPTAKKLDIRKRKRELYSYVPLVTVTRSDWTTYKLPMTDPQLWELNFLDSKQIFYTAEFRVRNGCVEMQDKGENGSMTSTTICGQRVKARQHPFPVELLRP